MCLPLLQTCGLVDEANLLIGRGAYKIAEAISYKRHCGQHEIVVDNFVLRSRVGVLVGLKVFGVSLRLTLKMLFLRICKMFISSSHQAFSSKQ